jgi:hypothetical protein
VIYVTYERITDEKAIVRQYINLDYVEKPVGVEGFEIAEIPQPPIPPIGKEVQTFVNPITKDFFYEYTDRPLKPEEKIQLLEQENEELKARIEVMQQALDELLLGGGM